MTVILFMANSLHSTLTNTSVCMHSQSQHNQEAHFDFFVNAVTDSYGK